MRVEDVMTSRVWTCGPDANLAEPAALMWQHEVGLVPVVDHDQRLVGVITDRDIAMAAMLAGRSLDRLPVSGSMTTDVATCTPGDALAVVEETMSARRVRRLPVVDPSNRVVGVVSLHDLATRAEVRPGDGPSATDLARTLRALCAPRERRSTS